jgi:hypothetical protein
MSKRRQFLGSRSRHRVLVYTPQEKRGKFPSPKMQNTLRCLIFYLYSAQCPILSHRLVHFATELDTLMSCLGHCLSRDCVMLRITRIQTDRAYAKAHQPTNISYKSVFADSQSRPVTH